jgi:hypothetical protein
MFAVSRQSRGSPRSWNSGTFPDVQADVDDGARDVAHWQSHLLCATVSIF